MKKGFRSCLSVIVARLRLVVIASIVLSAALALLGQPKSFWHDPKTAIRGDGLSVFAQTNHTFDFFLDQGMLSFLGANLLYMAVTFATITAAPRWIGLIASFAIIFAHGFGATNWLGTRFQLGVGVSPAIVGTVLGLLLSSAILPALDNPRLVIQRWRWLMLGALFVDFASTLAGQPSGFWQDPAKLHEGNTLVRMFLGRGWLDYLVLDLAIAAGEFFVVTVLPVPMAFVCVFAFTFGNFVGASDWFFFEWRWGWIAPVCFGIILSTVLAVLMMLPAKCEFPVKDDRSA